MRRALVLIAIVFALGACEARAEIEVSDDGSGTFGFSFVIEDQFLALMQGFSGGESEDPFEDFKQGLEDSPVPFQIEEFTEKGGRGIRATVPFRDVEDLRTIMKAVDESEPSSADNPIAGGGGPGFGTFTLERRGGGWHFEAVGEAPDLGDLGELGGGEGGEDAPFDPAQIASLLKVSFRVTLPGRTVTTSADDEDPKDGRTTFTWNADLTSTEPMQLVATTASAGSSFPMLPVAAGLGALAVAGAAVFGMKRRTVAALPPAPPPAQVPDDSPPGPPEPPNL